MEVGAVVDSDVAVAVSNDEVDWKLVDAESLFGRVFLETFLFILLWWESNGCARERLLYCSIGAVLQNCDTYAKLVKLVWGGPQQLVLRRTAWHSRHTELHEDWMTVRESLCRPSLCELPICKYWRSVFLLVIDGVGGRQRRYDLK